MVYSQPDNLVHNANFKIFSWLIYRQCRLHSKFWPKEEEWNLSRATKSISQLIKLQSLVAKFVRIARRTKEPTSFPTISSQSWSFFTLTSKFSPSSELSISLEIDCFHCSSQWTWECSRPGQANAHSSDT